jgi:hypothetical protein
MSIVQFPRPEPTLETARVRDSDMARAEAASAVVGAILPVLQAATDKIAAQLRQMDEFDLRALFDMLDGDAEDIEAHCLLELVSDEIERRCDAEGLLTPWAATVTDTVIEVIAANDDHFEI